MVRGRAPFSTCISAVLVSIDGYPSKDVLVLLYFYTRCISRDAFLEMHFYRCISIDAFLYMHFYRCISRNVFLCM